MVVGEDTMGSVGEAKWLGDGVCCSWVSNITLVLMTHDPLSPWWGP
jgi:hypothetical protein